jgi:hypothetical protein
LDKNKRKGEWSRAEDLLLLRTVLEQGRKWSTISHLLSDQRTEHMAKNRYHSLLNAAVKGDSPEQDEQHIIRNIIQELEKQVENGEAEVVGGDGAAADGEGV